MAEPESPHPSAEELIGLAAGDLLPEHAIQLSRHVDGCDTCRTSLADVRAVAATAASVGLGPVTTAPRPDFTADMRQATGALLARRRPGFRRQHWMLLAAAALLIAAPLLWYGLAGAAPPRVIATAVLERSENALRGTERRLHFRIQLPAPGEVTIVQIDGPDQIHILYPNAAAALPRLGMPAPLPAGASLRLPEDPLLDFPAVAATARATFLLVPSTDELSAAEREALVAVVQDAFAAAAGDDPVAAAVAAVRALHPGTVARKPRGLD